jgi:hypothetical protein
LAVCETMLCIAVNITFTDHDLKVLKNVLKRLYGYKIRERNIMRAS